ncbi:MAG: tripartite tricarboxylate transporter TctB family protein [Hyphomicrobiales bacterium]|nr:tripartite tricarboxylate transporter TctB family protein [Hyphomicrobiales bacterium]
MSRLSLRGGVDFYSGILLVVAAACCMWLVSDLDVGSAREMGPAYFPLTVAFLLAAMGLILIGRGLLVAGPAVQGFELRPLFFVIFSFAAFGWLITVAGLIPAILTQVAIAHFASSETRPFESLLFGSALAAFSAALFVYLLRIPVSLFSLSLLP